MKKALSENIRALRRERKMTQEQLAEALGVTVGAVHKWESRASMPEIRLLVELADLFGVSVDALLGYEMKSGGERNIVERIRAHLHVKDFERALTEAEKALIRHPNSFRVVHCCADVYERRGVETGDREALLRAIELMERSIPLLAQNDDPQISEVTIRSDIAVCHIELGERDKGLEILKAHNAGGINNALIGIICSLREQFVPGETEEYLCKGMGDVVSNAIRCMSGYINFHSRRGDIRSALEAAQWLTGFLSSLKTEPDAVCYLDRIIVTARAAEAASLAVLGRQEEAETLTHEAYRMAAAFDRAPVYGTDNIRFCTGGMKKQSMSDDLGETAVAAAENVLRADVRCSALLETWERLKAQDNIESGENRK